MPTSRHRIDEYLGTILELAVRSSHFDVDELRGPVQQPRMPAVVWHRAHGRSPDPPGSAL
jgi:hypothetical protein